MSTVASPFATGGGGEDFQTNVSVHYLIALLAQGFARGLGSNVVKEVRFQQLYQGVHTDDLIVIAGTPSTALHIQLKHQF